MDDLGHGRSAAAARSAWRRSAPSSHELFARCDEDPACAAAHPHVEETLYELVAAWDAAPVVVDLPDLATGTTRTRVVDGARLLQIVQGALLDYDQLRALPDVITRAAAGDPSALADVPGVAETSTTFQSGAFFSIWCTEEVQFYTPERIAEATAGLRPEMRAFGRRAIETNVAACRHWRAGNPRRVKRRPTTTRFIPPANSSSRVRVSPIPREHRAPTA